MACILAAVHDDAPIGQQGVTAVKEHQAIPLADGFVFLEGPRWHQGALWVSDMWGHEVLRVSEGGVRETVCAVPN